MARDDSGKTKRNINLDPTLGPESGSARENPADDPDRTLDPEQTAFPDTNKPSTGIQNDVTLDPAGPGKTISPLRRNVQVDGYDILEELGRGGMGVVYKARDKALNRTVALKMILAGAHASDEAIARFRIEAEAVAQLQHRGIVQVFDVGQSDGQPYCALEFVEGGGLDELIAQEPLAVVDSVALVEELAHAMSSAHQAGIVHRDLKPANILLSKTGSRSSVDSAREGKYRPKITDFGLARKIEQESQQTQTGAIMGTPGYMAPEQARGAKRIGPAADIYSLGAILYQLLTGRPPFVGETPIKTIMRVLNDSPTPPRSVNPEIDRDLDTIVLKCLEKEPSARYASAEHLAQDLQRYREGLPIEARPVSGIERVGKWIRRKPWAATMLALTTLGLIGVIVGGAVFNRRLASAYDLVDKEHGRAVKALEAEKKALSQIDTALKHAEASDAESRRRLIDNYVNNGLQAMNAKDILEALPWLSECITLEINPEKQELHQLRFNLAVQNAPKPDRTWLVDSMVLGCRFSSDGNRVAAWSGNRRLRIWDIPGNKIVSELEASASIETVSFSNDLGQAVVVSRYLNAVNGDFETNNFELVLWDSERNRTVGDVHTIQTAREVNFSNRISGEKGWLARKNKDASAIEILDLNLNEVVRTYQSEFAIDHFQLHPSGEYLWFGNDQRFVLLDCNHGAVILDQALDPDAEYQSRVAFEGDEHLILAADRLTVFHLHDGQPMASYPRTRSSGRAIVAIGSDDIGLTVAWPDGSLEIYDAQGDRVDHRQLDSRIVDAFYSHQGNTLFVATRFELLMFDPLTGNQTGSAIPATIKPLRSAVVSPDDRYVAIGSGAGIITGSGCLRVWSTLGNKAMVPLFDKEHRIPNSDIIANNTGDLLAVLDDHRQQLTIVKTTNRNRPRSILQIPQAPADDAPTIRSVAWSHSGNRLVVSLDNDLVKVFDIPSGNEILKCHLPFPGKCVFSDNDSRLAINYGEGSRLAAVVRVADGSIIARDLKHLRQILSMEFCQNDKWLTTISFDLVLRQFDATTGEKINNSNLAMLPVHADFDHQRNRVAVGGGRFGAMPGRVVVFELDTGEREGTPLDFDSQITLVRFSDDGELLAVTDSNGRVRIFQIPDGKEIGSAMVHPDLVNSIEFTHDGRLISTVCKDGRIRLFDVQSSTAVSPPLDNESGFNDAFFLGDTYDLCGRAETSGIWRFARSKFSPDHAGELSRFLSGRFISEKGTIVTTSPESLKDDFSNVTIRQMMESKALRQLFPN